MQRSGQDKSPFPPRTQEEHIQRAARFLYGQQDRKHTENDCHRRETQQVADDGRKDVHGGGTSVAMQRVVVVASVRAP
eukprot:scaffold1569_cov266-Pinguiococcus_pyrenoidosus.AAC.8